MIIGVWFKSGDSAGFIKNAGYKEAIHVQGGDPHAIVDRVLDLIPSVC